MSKNAKLSVYIEQPAIQEMIMTTLGTEERKIRYQSSVLSAISINPKLQECNPITIITASLQGEALELSPSPQMGHYYMVPFRNNKLGTTEAQFQLG